MDNEIVKIQILNPKVLSLLRHLDDLNLIKILVENTDAKLKLSDKYKGVFSKDDAENFDCHTRSLREEWDKS